MLLKFLNWFSPSNITDLEIVLRMISEEKEVRNAKILMRADGSFDADIFKDQNFMVGSVTYYPYKMFKYFLVRFSLHDKECIIQHSDDRDVLFIFDKPDEIKQIREAVIQKYKEYQSDNMA